MAPVLLVNDFLTLSRKGMKNMEKQYSLYKKGTLLLLVLQVTLLLISCAEIEQPRRFNELKNFKTLSIKQLYPEALSKALEWQSDAYLYTATIQIRHIEDRSPLRIYFVFRSTSNPNQYLHLYMIEHETGYDFEITAGEYQTEKSVEVPIDPDNLSLDTFEAFQIAFENGGQVFFERFKYPDMPLNIDLHSASQSKDGAYWTASFSDLDSNTLHIIINDKEGKVDEVKEFYSSE